MIDLLVEGAKDQLRYSIPYLRWERRTRLARLAWRKK